MDAVHYYTMLLVDRARQRACRRRRPGRTPPTTASTRYYDFAFGGFRYQGLEQHFWQPFEVRHRLKQAGFRRVRLRPGAAGVDPVQLATAARAVGLFTPGAVRRGTGSSSAPGWLAGPM